MILDSYAVLTVQGTSASQMTAAKVLEIMSRLPGCAGQAADAVSADTQVKNGGCTQITENSQIGMPIKLDTEARLPDAVVPLERNLYGHPLAGLLWERQFEKVLLKNGWEKVSNWECLFVHSEKGLFFSVYVDDKKLDGKKQNINPTWKVLNEEVDLGEPKSFLDHEYLGLYSTSTWKKQTHCWQLQNHVWIQNFRRSNWKITVLGKSAYFFVVLWYGRSCQEMCGTILWVGEQDDSTTLQSINSMHWRPSFQRRRIEIRGRIVKSVLSNCSEMLVFGTYWKTWYSLVSEQTCKIDHKLDQSMWQTIISFDRVHSPRKWLPTLL